LGAVSIRNFECSHSTTNYINRMCPTPFTRPAATHSPCLPHGCLHAQLTAFDSENRTRPYAEILIVRLHKHIMSRNYTSPTYNRPNTGRRYGASTDTNCLTVNVIQLQAAPVDAPSPPLPGLSARSIDSRLCRTFARTRWLELIAHYGDCTAPDKRVIEIALCLADIAFSIVFKCDQNNRFSITIR